MPAPRSKRKRPSDDDPPLSATARRRQREAASGAEPDNSEKNEESKSTSTDHDKSGAGADQSPTSLDKNSSDADQAVENPDEKEKSQGEKEKSQGGNGQGQPSSQPALTASVPRKSMESKSQAQNGQARTSTTTTTAIEKSGTAPAPKSGTAPAAAPSVLSGDSRDSRIRGLLMHRKILLKRLRQSRKAARAELGGVVVGSKPSAAATAFDDEQEIASFAGMTREVVSLARKQARIDTEVPGAKRTSVSLRRGSGVGKRMNAALSSLAPGGGGGGASSSVEEVPSQSLQPATKAPVAPRAPASAAAPTGPIPPPPAVSRVTSTSLPTVPLSMPKAPPPLGATRPAGQKTMSQKTASQKTNTGPRGMSSSAVSAPSAKPPLHTGLSGSILPPNRLAQPSVVCPEAAALRERRNNIRSKLLSLMTERQNQTQKTSSRRDSSGTLGDTSVLPSPVSSSSTSKSSRAERAAMVKGGGRPPHLPGRRKTHWDYLLEEMRWTATDFIEERKWKASTARTIGKAILSPKEPLVPQQTIRTPDPLRIDQTHTPKSSVSSDEEMDDASIKETKARKAKEDKQIERRSYVDVCSEHDDSARKTARILANMISELSASIIDAGAFAQTDAGYVKALKRHQRVRKQLEGDVATYKATEKVSNEIEPTGGPVSKNMVEERHHAENSPDKEANKESDHSERDKMFQYISDHVENFLDKTKKNGSKPKNQSTVAKIPGLQVSLSTSQTKSIDSIEDYWTRIEAGAILSGPFASGKTIVACALLWKHRSSGPQLLVCSPASMVCVYDVESVEFLCFYFLF
jgi:hypothetical protein